MFQFDCEQVSMRGDAGREHTPELVFPLLNRLFVWRVAGVVTMFRRPLSSLGNAAYAMLSFVFMLSRMVGGIVGGGG